MNEKVVKLLKEGMWDLATCANDVLQGGPGKRYDPMPAV